MNEDTEKFSLPVRCRPDKSSWVIVGFSVISGLFYLLLPLLSLNNTVAAKPTSPSDFITSCIMCTLVGAPFLAVSIWGALWIIFGEIIADENGLRWRTVRKWHGASWPQVLDYYYDTPLKKRATIEFGTKNLNLLSLLTQRDELQVAIAQYATNARTSRWEVLGLRPETDWPRTFEYKPENHLRGSIVPVIFAVLWVTGGFYMFWSVRGGLADIWQYSGAMFSLLGLIMFGLVLSFMPAFAWIAIATRREMQARRAQKIIISLAGLSYEDGAQRIECAWSEVLDYYRDPMAFWSPSDDRFVVVTPRGEWDFTLIEDRSLLQEIIERHATNAKYSHWRLFNPRHEILAAQGERVFSYRGREQRAIIIGMTIIIPFFVLLAFSMPPVFADNPPRADTPAPSAVLLSYALGIAAICWRAWVGEIRLTDAGATQRGVLGCKFLAWGEITQLRRGALLNCQIVGRGKRLGFTGFISDYKILREEIARRATKAEVLPSWWREDSDRTGT